MSVAVSGHIAGQGMSQEPFFTMTFSCTFSIAGLAAGAAVPRCSPSSESCSALRTGEVALGPSCSSSALLLKELLYSVGSVPLQMGPKVVQEMFKSVVTNTSGHNSIYLYSLGITGTG